MVSRVVWLAAAARALAPAAAPAAAPRARLRLPKLDADAFRHPLDKDLTSLIKNTPLALLERGMKATATPPIEQMLRLDNLATGLKVSEKQFPELYASFQEALAVLGGLKKEPELFVKSDPRPNAYTLAVQGGAPFVVVTSALVDNFSAEETQAVLGHELGHLVCEHSLWFSLGSIGSAFLPPLPGVGAASERALQSWRRAAEFSCDRAALLVAQDPAVACGALVKLASGSTRDVDIAEFLEQAREYDEALKTSNRFVRLAMQSSLADATHPLPVRRVAELDKFAKSDEYARILAAGVAPSVAAL